ncbi:MAG: TIGR02757 family protein [Bacteroidales bacterium]|jgi:uncharacterized protein (TIGR02757 family)
MAHKFVKGQVIPEALKEFLNFKAEYYNHVRFIPSDPISIPHLFTRKEDIEISGFFSAIIAWGQRPTIIKNATKLVEWMDYSPFDFILNFNESDLKPFSKFVHRTFNGEDCDFFLWSLKNIYQNYQTLENAFTIGFSESEINVKQAIILFRKRFFEIESPARTQKQIANPSKNSSSKRINMFLRWMVRKDKNGVDFGIWNKIQPSQLVCPLDVHVANVSRKIGLLSRKMNDWKAAEELTEILKTFDRNDPVKYDFALFGLGVFEKF